MTQPSIGEGNLLREPEETSGAPAGDSSHATPILGVCTLVERVPPLLVLEPQLHRRSSRRAVWSALRPIQQIYLDLI